MSQVSLAFSSTALCPCNIPNISQHANHIRLCEREALPCSSCRGKRDSGRLKWLVQSRWVHQVRIWMQSFWLVSSLLFTLYHTCLCLSICSICHHVPLNASWRSSLTPYFYWSLELGEDWNRWRSGTGLRRVLLWKPAQVGCDLGLVRICWKLFSRFCPVSWGNLPLWAMTWGRAQYFQPVCLQYKKGRHFLNGAEQKANKHNGKFQYFR